MSILFRFPLYASCLLGPLGTWHELFDTIQVTSHLRRAVETNMGIRLQSRKLALTTHARPGIFGDTRAPQRLEVFVLSKSPDIQELVLYPEPC